MRVSSDRPSLLPMAALLLLALTTLYLLSEATQNIDQLGRYYTVLLVLSLVVLLGLISVITRNLLRLLSRLRRKEMGSRLTLRMVTLFILLTVIPSMLVFGFAQQFLRTGIDSWFDVRVADALDDALKLSQAALEQTMRIRLQRTERTARILDIGTGINAGLVLDEQRQVIGATELSLWGTGGRMLVTSNADPTVVVPTRPSAALMVRVRGNEPFVGLEPAEGGGLLIRILMQVPSHQGVLLHATFPVAKRISDLAGNVEQAYDRYRELAYLRGPLKFSFTLTLALILLLSLLSAVWAAFVSARRLVAPIADLAEGTRAVAKGNYDTRLPWPKRNDELGLLVRLFNDMTSRIARARDAVHRSETEAIAQRTYLETVLKHLSSGVLTVDSELRLRTCNPASTQVLGLALDQCLSHSLHEIGTEHPRLLPLSEAILAHTGQTDWNTEIHLMDQQGRPRILLARGALLPSEAGQAGDQVLVFDDVTRLIQAQRDAAWGEVARRLAHEIKNPLTPIQLSAERLRHKYLRKLSPEDGKVLDRLTGTITKQVETMKEMVNAFSEYARSPKLNSAPLDLNALVREVTEMYRGQQRVKIELRLDDPLPPVRADHGRLRQVLHNLIKNANEAMDTLPDGTAPRILVTTTDIGSMLELQVIDNGPGIADKLRDNLFEPYVTSKEKGSGLGLAVVKKILEEHGGDIAVHSSPGSGTAFRLHLPVERLDGAAAPATDAAGPGAQRPAVMNDKGISR